MKLSKKRKACKTKHVRFHGGGQCDNHVSLFANNILGGSRSRSISRSISRSRSRSRNVRKKPTIRNKSRKDYITKGGSFSNLVTNIVNPILYTNNSYTDQPAIMNYYATNAVKI